MAFQQSPITPSLSPSQQPENYWRANRNFGASSPNRLPGYGLSQSPGVPHPTNSFFNKERSLPMYKDKPYFAPRRTGPRSRRRKVLYGGIVVFVVTCLWYFTTGSRWDGYGMRRTPDSEKGAELWRWIQSFEEAGSESGKTVDWEARRERVRDAFIVSWDSYERHGWGFDEYHPVAKNGRHMIEGGLGWQIVDALDTMMIMNLTSRVQHARNWIHNSLQYNQDHDVNTFETTIRMLGGLLSAHYLSTTYPDLASITDDDLGAPGEDLYIEKATDLADRLLGAFESKSGIPYASINLNKSEGLPSHADGGASSTAEATSVQLEFKYLAKLTGEAEYWRTVEKVMEVVDAQHMEDGLLPIYIHPDSGQFRGRNIRLGSRGDSYYEYLIKQYLQTSKQEPIYKEMWDEALMGVRKHLITYTKKARLTVLGERPDGLHGELSPKMDHLVCFFPGTIALGATGGQPLSVAKKSPEWTQRQDEEIVLAKELMKTCWATYAVTKTGLAPEITYFNIDNPPTMMSDMYPDMLAAGSTKSSGKDLPLTSKPLDSTTSWQDDLTIHTGDRHNLQRPETIESLFYMYRITSDPIYRTWGWEMFKSFIKHTAIVETDETKTKSQIVGFSSLNNVNSIPATQRDNMESFWSAETLKYFYLLFSEREFLSLEENVFNTEAHPMPRFGLGGELKTGWVRSKPT